MNPKKRTKDLGPLFQRLKQVEMLATIEGQHGAG